MAIWSRYTLCFFAVYSAFLLTSHLADSRPHSKTKHHNHAINDLVKPNGTSSAMASACEPQDEAARERKENNQHLFHPKTPSTYGIQTFDTSDELPKSTVAPGDSQCGYHGGSGAERQSSCTWSYHESYDPHRIPQTLMIAKCDACDFCMDSNGYPLNDTMACAEVYYNMKVLRRKANDADGCIDGMFKYEMFTERIPIACSCQRIA